MNSCTLQREAGASPRFDAAEQRQQGLGFSGADAGAPAPENRCPCGKGAVMKPFHRFRCSGSQKKPRRGEDEIGGEFMLNR
jgi:hypothetical protein